jgi:hypothetical protein
LPYLIVSRPLHPADLPFSDVDANPQKISLDTLPLFFCRSANTLFVQASSYRRSHAAPNSPRHAPHHQTQPPDLVQLSHRQPGLTAPELSHTQNDELVVILSQYGFGRADRKGNQQ